MQKDATMLNNLRDITVFQKKILRDITAKP